MYIWFSSLIGQQFQCECVNYSSQAINLVVQMKGETKKNLQKSFHIVPYLTVLLLKHDLCDRSPFVFTLHFFFFRERATPWADFYNFYTMEIAITVVFFSFL